MSRRYLLFLGVLLACGRHVPEAQLSIVGGASGRVVDNLIKFTNPDTGRLICGSGYAPHPRVMITPKHCADKRSPEALTVGGKAPIASFTVGDILSIPRKSLEDAGITPGYFDEFADLDFMVLVYEHDVDLFKLNSVNEVTPISEIPPATDDAIGVAGYGISKRSDLKEKKTLGIQRYAVGTLKGFDRAIWSFNSKNPKVAVPAEFAQGDSGGVVVNTSMQAIALAVGFEPISETEYASYAIDLTSAPIKRFFQLAGQHCKLMGKDECMPWFPGAWDQSEYYIGAGVEAKEVDKRDVGALLKRLEDKANYDQQDYQNIYLPRLAYVPARTPASIAGLSVGDRITKIGEGPAAVFNNATLMLYSDIAGKKDAKISAVSNDRNYSISPLKVDKQYIISRSAFSTKPGYQMEFPDNSFGANAVALLLPGAETSAYRALKVSKLKHGGIAREVGLKDGDEIEEINYRFVHNGKDVFRALEQKGVDGYNFRLRRRGRYENLTYKEKPIPPAPTIKGLDLEFVYIKPGEVDEKIKYHSFPVTVDSGYFISKRGIRLKDWIAIVGCAPSGLHESEPRCAEADEPKRFPCYGGTDWCYTLKDVNEVFLSHLWTKTKARFELPDVDQLAYALATKQIRPDSTVSWHYELTGTVSNVPIFGYDEGSDEYQRASKSDMIYRLRYESAAEKGKSFRSDFEFKGNKLTDNFRLVSVPN